MSKQTDGERITALEKMVSRHELGLDALVTIVNMMGLKLIGEGDGDEYKKLLAGFEAMQKTLEELEND